MAQISKDVPEACERFSAYTALDVDDLKNWARTGLVTDIDEAVGNPYFQHTELSELLAERRRAPDVRFPDPGPSALLRPLRGAGDAERYTVADRDLRMSITAFARERSSSRMVPSTSRGLCGLQHHRDERSSERSFDKFLPVHRCGQCGSLDTTPTDESLKCSVCGEEMRAFSLYQPEVTEQSTASRTMTTRTSRRCTRDIPSLHEHRTRTRDEAPRVPGSDCLSRPKSSQ